MLAEVIVSRKATAEDAPLIANLFQVVYGESSHPCKHAGHVFESIASGLTLWRVALDEGVVIACGTLLLNFWNRCWELGRTVTLPQYRSAGMATRLMQQCVEEACASSLCDLMFGFPRSRTMLKIAQELAPPFHPVGHDGAINVANGEREYHTITFAAKANASFQHFVPADNSLADSKFVQENIFAPLGLLPERGEYPPIWVAGSGNGPGPFSSEYDPACASASLEITGCNTHFSSGAEVTGALLSFLSDFPFVRHLRMAVPIDKTDFIACLLDTGFEITAYLPTWFRVGNGRYDCLLVVRRSFEEEPADHGVRDVVEHFRRGLNDC